MNKEQYFKNLDDIVSDPIYIGKSEDDIHLEIQTNMWRISLDGDLVNEITIADFNQFIYRIIHNRQVQINNSDNEHGMIFYLWFDWMASQLRFNLISDINEQLPFNCEVESIEDLDIILKEFLEFPYHDGLPVVEESNEEEEEKSFVQKVFILKLDKRTKTRL
jgi:hypothetical protein